MAINKNHEFEDLDGVKCAIVERNVTEARLAFLKALLEYNKFTVIAVPAQAEPVTYTVGVTDVTFNPVNAIFGRLLRSPNGKVVTLACWQKGQVTEGEAIPYFANNPECN
ncbi:hypothetical protein [Flavihumibacter fluvii]|uniref:hypothetical protein n=1 Tax=Flavihumibacter fluvii TaxID=2838157 RepID=UPI001BDE60DE|nr:hypothetical protein [Flavihumibacter fluvii]ULQ52198.1 hypothetical protein KJS93_19090 [Flavihumibacter fluvii]